MGKMNLKSQIEAILFAVPEPVSSGRIAGVLGIKPDEVRRIVSLLNQEYREQERPYIIKEVSGGFIMYTLPEYGDIIAGVLGKKYTKLSRASMVTLAIIAYKQPVPKSEIDRIRGVDSQASIQTLLEADLIKVVGRGEGIGHPYLYGTTKKFLEIFKLKSLKDLPPINDEDSPLFSAGRDNLSQEG